MTAPAAIQGDYVDLRFIKSRKVCQVVIEIPIEAGASFVAAFGTPNPAEGVPVALARLDMNAKPERKGGRLAQKAGILCNEGGFAQFLRESVDVKFDGEMQPKAETVAAAMRQICGVQSRADLDHDEAAAARFNALVSSYELWLKIAA